MAEGKTSDLEDRPIDKQTNKNNQEKSTKHQKLVGYYKAWKHMHIKVLEREVKEREEKICKNNNKKILKFNERYKSIHPRSMSTPSRIMAKKGAH